MIAVKCTTTKFFSSRHLAEKYAIKAQEVFDEVEVIALPPDDVGGDEGEEENENNTMNNFLYPAR